LSKEEEIKIGLEIHFQLNTKRKLFCHCPVGLAEPKGAKVIRRLRPTQSELGQIDPAAYFEFQKGVTIEYIAPQEYTCLVELDEEPPHKLCEEALHVAIAVAKYLNCKLLDEFEVMRKVVIDGSNPTGFQRTLVIATDGHIKVDGKPIKIQTICLEEEAARLIEKRGNVVVYALDRLGIPLIEIATGPDINSADEAVKVAEYLGRIVSATGMRRRGIGTIRQDINISVRGGNVVEIKGVQKLQQLKRVIEFEYARHKSLLKIKDELSKRGVKKEDLRVEYVDVSNIFLNTKSKLISKLLKAGNIVVAVRLKGFSGLLGMETAPGYRLGKEISERVRFWTGLGGIIHSDELPGYGISIEEVNQVRNVLQCNEKDAFVLIISSKDKVDIAVEKVIERAREALDGVPTETRGAKDDGTTFYMRPRPGMARMYPETDIPPIRLTNEILTEANKYKIIPPDEIIKSLIKLYGINEELAWKLYDSGMIGLFKELAKGLKRIKPSYVASTLTELLKYIEREGFDISKLSDDIIIKTIRYVDNGVIEKEVIPDIWVRVIRGEGDLDSIVKRFAEERVKPEQIINYINQLIHSENIRSLPDEIKKKRLIGIVMSKYRGKVDPKFVIETVNKVLEGENIG